jgi:hypothetical protein
MTTNQATPAAAEVLLEALATGEFGALRPHLTPNTLFDATVPGWRFQIEGTEAIISQLHHWWPTEAQLPTHRITPTSEGFVVEFERRWVEDGEPAGCRQVHVLTIQEQRLAEMRILSAGRWDEETLRVIDTEAPIFRQ